jgi:ectoine hydroxylase-related dioxygenase (phytanoyl-CoA dioxygenase family)
VHQQSFDTITDAARDAYARDGAICLRGAFAPWVDTLRAGVRRNHESPGPYFAENVAEAGGGSFWDDYCNWPRIPEFRQFLFESEAARTAAGVMASSTAQLFHDHVLVKEPGTSKPTPWHQDAPYYFVEGMQTVSFWLPLDPVREAQSLKLVAGSHTWPKMVRPVKWLDESDFYDDAGHAYMDAPPLDELVRDGSIRSWAMEPGDAVLFHFRTLHGAAGNELPTRRRAFSVRWVGDDARYVARAGRTSPPFPGHGMTPGQRLRQDWFPVLWPRKLENPGSGTH